MALPDWTTGGLFAFVFLYVFAMGGLLAVCLFYNYGLFMPRRMRQEYLIASVAMLYIMVLVVVLGHRSPVFLSTGLLGLCCSAAVLVYLWRLGR